MRQQISLQSPSGQDFVRTEYAEILSQIQAKTAQAKDVQHTAERLRDNGSLFFTAALLTAFDLYVHSTSLLKEWFPVLQSDYTSFLVSGGLIFLVAFFNWKANSAETKFQNLKLEISELRGKKGTLEKLFPTLKD